MRTFRLLYFRNWLLERAAEVRAPDVVGAVEKASGQPADVRVEVWSPEGRGAVISPSPAMGPAPLRPTANNDQLPLWNWSSHDSEEEKPEQEMRG